MIKKMCVLLAVVAVSLAVSSRYAARVLGASNSHILITEPIDEGQLVTLAGNTRPEAKAANDHDVYPIASRSTTCCSS